MMRMGSSWAALPSARGSFMELVNSSRLRNVAILLPLTFNTTIGVVCAWAGLGWEPGLISITKSAKPTTKAASTGTHVPLLLTALLSMRHRLSVEGWRIKGANDLHLCLLWQPK